MYQSDHTTIKSSSYFYERRILKRLKKQATPNEELQRQQPQNVKKLLTSTNNDRLTSWL